jgi:hypothetical protein
VAVACDGGGGTEAAAGEQAEGAPTTVEVMLSDFEISPSTIQVPVDVRTSFKVMNMTRSRVRRSAWDTVTVSGSCS